MIFIIVESPTKAKALNEYLKNEKQKYIVLSTYGHIRNLIAKAGSIASDKNYEYSWEITPQWEKHKQEILEKAKNAQKIIIATDLDREGEGIAWHFLEMLKINKITTQIERIIFHSISKESIKEALSFPQLIRNGLIESYLARIGLDYLFGFSISPILWRKIPCCKSAGRVQSIALRLIVERENEILNFVSKKYQTIHAKFAESEIEAMLIEFNNEKIENGQVFKPININFDPQSWYFQIQEINKQQKRISAPAPFTTSTLQQAASNSLNFAPKLTMQLAQKLYEGFKIDGNHIGLITYMRTDSVKIEPEFIDKIRTKITKKYGKEFVPQKLNNHKTSSKNAQEAHEAIRVTNLELITPNLGDENLEKLYQLIWQRTVASQMPPAVFENLNIKILANEKQNNTAVFEIKTSKLLFPGYKILYEDEEQKNKIESHNLIDLQQGELLNCNKIFAKEHETQPPNRCSEAMLINLLEKNGTGRPSTYAKIIQVLYDREYAQKNKKNIIPTQKGFIVIAFLKYYFPDEINYEFTSKLEDELDNLNQSNENHIQLLDKFWKKLNNAIQIVKEKNPIEVSQNIQSQFGRYFLENETICPECKGKLFLKITKFGAIRGCENYPNCKKIINLEQKSEEQFNNFLGKINNNDCFIKTGPYGLYIEIIKDENKKRIPIPKIWQSQMTLEKAQLLAELPKTIGMYNEQPIIIAIGRFGMFIKHENTFVAIKDPYINQEDAISLLEKKIIKQNNLNKPLKMNRKKKK